MPRGRRSGRNPCLPDPYPKNPNTPISFGPCPSIIRQLTVNAANPINGPMNEK